MLDIIKYGDPLLTTKTQEVMRFDRNLELLVADMQAAMQRDRGIGLAAPQVGFSERIFVVGLEGESISRFYQSSHHRN